MERHAKVNNRAIRAMQNSLTDIPRMKYSSDLLSLVLNGTEKKIIHRTTDTLETSWLLLLALEIFKSRLYSSGVLQIEVFQTNATLSSRRNIRNVVSSRLIQPAGILPSPLPLHKLASCNLTSVLFPHKKNSLTIILHLLQRILLAYTIEDERNSFIKSYFFQR